MVLIIIFIWDKVRLLLQLYFESTMNAKKILWYTVFLPLALSSVMVLGLLSFIGVLAIPGLGLAASIILGGLALGFTIAYEGEVYLQNIKGAFNKLFLKKDYFKLRLGKQFLYSNFPLENDRPALFTEQLQDISALDKLDHSTLSKAQKKIRKQLKFRIKMRERWLVEMLFDPTPKKTDTPYLTAARLRLSTINANNIYDKRKMLETLTPAQLVNRVQRNNRWNYLAIVFSVLVATGMGVGSIYLLATQLLLIPFIPLLPVAAFTGLVVSLALLSGVAYGFIIYNAVTDMIANSTLKTWSYKVVDAFKSKNIIVKVGLPISAVVLVSLAVLMTVFTMGTWWYIVKAAVPVVKNVVNKTPAVVGIIVAALTGLSAFIFNIENSFETLGIFNKWVEKKSQPAENNHEHHKQTSIFERENWLQIINIPRLWLKCVNFLNKVFFFTHIVAEGFGVDLPNTAVKNVATVTALGSNFMADYSYILGHEHHSHSTKEGEAHYAELVKARAAAGHGHSHDDNIPSKIIKFLGSFGTLAYKAAAFWDHAASMLNDKHPTRKPISYKNALLKHKGKPPQMEISDPNEIKPKRSDEFCTAAAIDNITLKQQNLEKAWFNQAQAQRKAAELGNLTENLAAKSPEKSIKDIIAEAKKKPAMNTHRFYKFKHPTATHAYLEEVSKAYSPSPAA